MRRILTLTALSLLAWIVVGSIIQSIKTKNVTQSAEELQATVESYVQDVNEVIGQHVECATLLHEAYTNDWAPAEYKKRVHDTLWGPGE